jgi:hypothetical protein
VPEHFSSPLLQLAEKDDSIELVNLPSGTGQHIASLDAGEIDVSIALTEVRWPAPLRPCLTLHQSLLAGIASAHKQRTGIHS